ncbi:MAG TPA: hypothetical protein VN925_06180 [Steroidobacteraceae bacterium]|nr:hypothetical protein [Steroidobacteraceae bacterium]
MRALSPAMAALCLAFVAYAVRAQQDLQPAVQTSAAAAPVTAGPPSALPAASGASPAAINRNGKPSEPRSAKPAPTAAKPAPAAPAASPAAAASGAPLRATKSSDRIELDTTRISGNRELPKVMYVVPWRKADPGEFTGRPLNSLLDEALTPVDRDVFRRQNRYYAALAGEPESVKSQPGAAGEGAAAPTPKDEK